MRSIFSEVPFLKLVLPLVAGVVLQLAIGDSFRPLVACTITGAAVLVLGAYLVAYSKLNIKAQFRFKATEGISMVLALGCVGYLLTQMYAPVNYRTHFSNYTGNHAFYIATIQQPVREKEKIVAAVAEVSVVKSDGQLHATQGEVLLNFVKDEHSLNLQYGDRIILHSEAKDIEPPKNPYEFDFKQYQKLHRIYQSAYVNSADWTLLSSGNGNALMAYVYNLRNLFLQIIKKHVTNPDDLAVASAMLLGYRDYMTTDVVQAYANAGTMHVLSVSGLHVGVMFLILNFLLGWMDKRGRKWKIGKTVLVIAFIWFYACLTGLSPSVLRAATMFSMLQLGSAINRHANTYNTIAASVFVLMLFNPFIIADVGFLLSYIAVIGIVYIYPKIYSLFVTKVWLLDKAWQITAMSVAAQIATFPISVYYFYQFPNLFLFSNLLMVPASGFIMYLGMALFAVNWIPVIGNVTGWLLAKLIWLTNWLTFYADTIPYNKTEGLNITLGEMWLLYLAFFFACIFIETKARKWFLAVLVCCLVLSVSFAVDYAHSKTQKQLAVYSVKGQRAIAFIANRQVVHNFDSALLNNRTSMLFHIKHHWWRNEVCKEENDSAVVKLLPFGRLISFAGKQVVIVDGNIYKPENAMPRLYADYVILSGNANVHLQTLEAVIDFKELVFDSSNKPKQLAKWKDECRKMQLTCYDVSKQGAFIRNL